MRDPNQIQKPLRVASVIASLTAGGIGPVCHYAAEGMAKLTGWQMTLLSLHDPVDEFIDKASGLRIVSLGLDGNCARLFLRWLAANPQDLVITSDVCRIEPAFCFILPETRHVVQIHDSGRRYREVAVRHATWLDGVTCVGQHIEAPLRQSLAGVGFRGLLRTVHNGANFPPQPVREPRDGPLRLLFMGGVTPLKGAFDLVPLLRRLRKLGVPVSLNIVGGQNDALRRQLQRAGLDRLVTWTGRVPHEQCYAAAAESDLLLVPSRKESFGMVTIEAMSMGCVPIAYDIPSGSTEIIEAGESGLLVRLGDLRAWAEQIRGLHHDRTQLAKLSAAAIARARDTFNADTMARNLAAYLSDVIAHTITCAPQRKSGMPPESAVAFEKPTRGYQRLPAGIRDWIRDRVHAHPKVSYWLLSR